MWCGGRRVATTLLALGLVTTGCGTAPEPGEPGPALGMEPAAAAPPSSVEPQPERFTLVASGDVLIHTPLIAQSVAEGRARGGRDFRPLFSGVQPVVSEADLAICHLEVPLGDADGPFRGYPVFNAPPEVAEALAATGYDACTTASNHTLDQGEQGVATTLEALDAAGIRHTGSARTKQEAEQPLLLEVNGARVGLVSFTYGFNGFQRPQGKEWMANLLDVEEVLAQARAARRAGADVVVVALHWGAEYQHAPTEEQQALARQLLPDPDIDLIIGHHAHVVQPFERIGDEWVAYGLGNHVAVQALANGRTEEGVIARFTFARDGDRWRVEQAEYLPTLIKLGSPVRVVDLTAPDGGGIDPERRARALERIDEVVLSRGAAEAGLTRPGR
ncbi:MAG TPA: CapA family protein [Pseudonocardiaceae bacterium]